MTLGQFASLCSLGVIPLPRRHELCPGPLVVRCARGIVEADGQGWPRRGATLRARATRAAAHLRGSRLHPPRLKEQALRFEAIEPRLLLSTVVDIDMSSAALVNGERQVTMRYFDEAADATQSTAATRKLEVRNGASTDTYQISDISEINVRGSSDKDLLVVDASCSPWARTTRSPSRGSGRPIPSVSAARPSVPLISALGSRATSPS